MLSKFGSQNLIWTSVRWSTIPAVLEYYDQPPSIPLAYQASNGRRLSVLHTPDYFVLRYDSAGWEECKTAEDLEKLAVKRPNRYLRDSGGNWRCPPGEACASSLGLYYRVRSSAEINWILRRNLQFLEDYLRFDRASVNGFVDTRIREAVQAQSGILLRDLLEQTAKHDEIYLLIATGELYVDLRTVAIAEPDQVHVFASAETAAAYRRACGYGEDPMSGARMTGLPTRAVASHSDAFRLIAGASEQDLKTANRRFDLVRRHLEGEATPQEVPARTLRLWVAQYRLANETYGSGYVGLLPKTARRGNRTTRLPEESRNLLAKFIEDDYENLKQKTRAASWATLKRTCEEHGVAVPSYVTFCVAVRERPAYERTLLRIAQ